MKTTFITLFKKKYPIRNSMGAMRRFFKLTGKEVGQIGNDIDLLCTFIYCCVASACNADEVEFDIDEDRFVDGLSISDINTFSEALMADSDGEDTKKKELA